MFTIRERLGLAVLGCLCLGIGSLIASYAVTGNLTWGWDASAWYQSYRGERQIGTPMSGQRIISTNNGGLALVFTPFLLSAVLLAYHALANRSLPGLFWGAVWLSPFVAAPVYAILFVNLLYDGMGITSVANPWVVMLLPTLITVVLWFNPKGFR